ncbi:hypothetical protein [uncultured Campylobacter sp.]|uniref:hypothetical protein n=1 Tax=uncultured Campylobacter sp. TaxID=218934 RepID=UPI00262B0764|nr:hypothetical protein [uncultured Campylobacter sp.]
MATKDPYADARKVLYWFIVAFIIIAGAIVYEIVVSSDANYARIKAESKQTSQTK